MIALFSGLCLIAKYDAHQHRLGNQLSHGNVFNGSIVSKADAATLLNQAGVFSRPARIASVRIPKIKMPLESKSPGFCSVKISHNMYGSKHAARTLRDNTGLRAKPSA
jgi:hypothetical protein